MTKWNRKKVEEETQKTIALYAEATAYANGLLRYFKFPDIDDLDSYVGIDIDNEGALNLVCDDDRLDGDASIPIEIAIEIMDSEGEITIDDFYEYT
jgi:hypothetical protein